LSCAGPLGKRPPRSFRHAIAWNPAIAEEAKKTLDRTEAMHEGISVTTARVLEVQRDARIAAAQLAEARAKLALLRAGTRDEDVREAQARLNVAAAELEASRARLEQCSVRAPADGVVLDVLTNPGRFVSLAVPEPLLHVAPDGTLRVRAEVEPRDFARVCVSQAATVSAEPFPNLSIRAPSRFGERGRHAPNLAGSGRGRARQGRRGRGPFARPRRPGASDRASSLGAVRGLPDQELAKRYSHAIA
jgi:multidrug efflux pump subunit AcrA (membrane-fusion protein)